MEERMHTTEAIDEALDGATWAREITVDELNGVSEGKTNEASRRIGIREPAAGRQMHFRVFNSLTMAAYYPEQMFEFFNEEYPDIYEAIGMSQITKFRNTELENQIRRFDHGCEVINQKPVDLIAEALRLIQQPNHSDGVRYYAQPHARLIRTNFNQFNMAVGPLAPNGGRYYRVSAEPIRLVSSQDITSDALEW